MTTVKEWIEEKKIGIGERDKYGYTLMHHAAREGRIDVMEYLHSLGINFDIGIPPSEFKDSGNKQPIHIAASRGCIESLKWFKEQGISLQTPTVQLVGARGDAQPMHFAAQFGRVETMEFLKSEGVLINV